MQLVYVGFEQAKNVREYIFRGVTHGEEDRVFVVSTDMALFLEFHLGIQEGPIMCLRTLAAELAVPGQEQQALRHTINEGDIRAYMADPPFHAAKKSGTKRPFAHRNPAL